jgi:protein LTV1
MEGKNQMIEADEYFEMIKEDEDEEAKLVDATRRLIIKMDKEAETFQGDYEEVEVEEREEWDCESILSTYSNIYNRPTIIHDGKDRSDISLDQSTAQNKILPFWYCFW